LVASTFLVSQTKCSAVRHILANYTVSEELEKKALRKIDTYMESSLNEFWEHGGYKPDLMYTPEEAAVVQGSSDTDYKTVPQVPLYYGNVFGLYAEEDLFDQVLCLLAREIGIELVVLSRMVGAKQVVVEVLDSRSREDSLKNLVFV
jgi:hypothetical protein